MSFLRLVGLVALAFGPAIVVFATVVAKRAQLVLLMVTSAFCELLALVVTGLLWQIPALQESPAGTIALGVIFQEVMRFVFFRIYERGDAHIRELMTETHKSPFTDFSTAIASGLGFGVIYALIMYGSVLEASLEPGEYFSDSCPDVSGFIITALLALIYQVMHLALSVVMLDAVRRKKTAVLFFQRIVLILALHSAVSFSSLLNDQPSAGGCKVGLPVQTIFVMVCVAAAVWAVREPGYAIIEGAQTSS